MTHDVDLSRLSPRELIRISRASLIELHARDIVRTMNAPLGDWCELLVAAAFDGVRAPNSEKGWDVETGDGDLLQVKARATSKSVGFSAFRSFDFHAAIFVVCDPSDLAVTEAKRIAARAIEQIARRDEHVNGFKVTLSQIRQAPGEDVTEPIANAQRAVEDYLQASTDG